MADLSRPIEFLELLPEAELVTRVTRWEQGTTEITNRATQEEKTIPVVRIFVPPEDKPSSPAYWDVSATTLIPSLLEYLPTITRENRWIRIRKFGVAPRARFQLEVYPPGQGGPAFAGVRR